MPNIAHDHSAGDTVSYITDCGIKSGEVVTVFGSARATATVVYYEIQQSPNERVYASASDVFATLPDALTEYENRLQ